MTGRGSSRARQRVGLRASLDDAAASLPAQDAATGAARRRGLGSAGLARTGRVVLWAFVGLVLIGGLGAIFGGGEATDRDMAAAAERRFPDDEARAFAVRFTHAYLGGSKQEPETYRRAVVTFLAEDLRERATAILPADNPSGWPPSAPRSRSSDARGLFPRLREAAGSSVTARPSARASARRQRESSSRLSATFFSSAAIRVSASART